MRIIRRVVVFDAGDIDAASGFWAGLLGGTVHPDDDERFAVYASPAGHPFCFGLH